MSSGSHLCVLIHGLWGNPEHLNFLKSSLRESHPTDDLHILVTTRNKGNHTYDGIEVGGERVTREIEEQLDQLAKEGHNVTKISIIGYSLGGLVARYAIGLLYSRGWFDKLEPMNFTTFATPHLGVRTPRIGYSSKVWNFLGSRTLSVSGQQMFIIDKFRDTNRPLLSIMAEPSSTFIRGLKRFKNRSLYANIINDRSVPYYTSMIVATDPYVELDTVDIHYLPSHSPILLDSSQPTTHKGLQARPDLAARLSSSGRNLVNRLPLLAFFTLILPFGASLYLINSAVQSVQSARRIKAHESGTAGHDFGLYRIPQLLEQATDRAFENAENSRGEDFLPSSTSGRTEKQLDIESGSDGEESDSKAAAFPTLALVPEQFEMIKGLDEAGLEKFAVHIQSATHTHAAIIVRMPVKRFDDGKVVVKHWTDRFEL